MQASCCDGTAENDTLNYTLNYTLGYVQSCEEYGDVIYCIHNYVIPLIVFFGLIGNLLAATIFLNTKLKSRSSSVYLGALSLADFGYLATLTVVNLSYADVVDLYNVNVLCQALVYTSSVCSILSVWLIVAFTAERFVAVKYPLRCPQVCTVARARAITLAIVLAASVTQLYTFWTAGVNVAGDGSQECEMRPEYAEHMTIINYLDTLFALILPLLVIVVLNAMIVRALVVLRGRLFADGECSRSTSYNSADREGLHNSNYLDDSSRSYRSRNISLVHHERRLLSSKCQMGITKMLLLISTVFVILNVPSYAVRLYVFALHSILDVEPPAQLLCIQWMLMTLFYINYSINFLLYSMCAATFRKALINVLLAKIKRLKAFVKALMRKLY